MKESKGKLLPVSMAKKLALRFALVIVLLSATVIVRADRGYFWGYLPNGDTAWLWCGPGGNYWTRCDTGSCPPGESCPCDRCDTSECQETANAQCDLLAD